MATRRDIHTATLLLDGTVLVVGGDSEIDTQPGELYDPASASWSATGKLHEGRYKETATLLADGTVLVVGGGGYTSGIPEVSAELYDPRRGRWADAGTMDEGRAGHTATLLSDGKVLVAGGAKDPDGDQVLASAELYDPSTGSWTATGDMSEAHSGHTATLLPDGRVLVAGGGGPFVNPTDSRTLASAELYDPVSGRWTAVPSMTKARSGHTSTLLADGKVLVVGGSVRFGVPVEVSELYDPDNDSWTALDGMIEARSGHTATLLPDGTVLAAGGMVGKDALATSGEIYDPGVESWTATQRMITPRNGHTATLLPDRTVLVAGGISSSFDPLDSAELYDPGR